MSDVILDGQSLTPAGVEAVARDGATVSVAEPARERLRESRVRVEDVMATDEAVYGLNTGFGSLVNERIPAEDIRALQTNLLRSHASGAGRYLSPEEVRAMMVSRVNSLVKGYSGVREVVVDHLVTMLNEGVHPAVRSRGSLGASGDLAPLAHMALVLLGEGEVLDGDGHIGGETALEQVGLEPLELEPKEGLALINGTQLTTGLAALFVVDAERVLEAADVAGALTTEVTMGTTASCDAAIQEVRPHDGQCETARRIKRLTADSEIVESHRNCDRVQDAYSVRCIPQVHGAVRDALDHLRSAVETELNSATDNPLVFDADRVDSRSSGGESAAVLSGGNFHGEPLALRLDYAVNALTELATISERRTNRMLDPNLQEAHLTPYLTNDPGQESGFMIAQYTAAALVNELRSIGSPATDNTPVSGGQEDHVSMSGQSALLAGTAVENAASVVAVELLAGNRASAFVDDSLAHGTGTGVVRDLLSSAVQPWDGDRPLDDDVELVADLVRFGDLGEQLERTVLEE
ncbi:MULTISPECIES: histidine ammonia-lyase [Halolamina]|uniref:Histidine ammonia-lyase n=1 Tax=Halolamina pelagica TaxID=699431 RepID=A0A1I5TQ38_9EURY|nr:MULTISPECIES: histidine ammonia-lyase [Halolamina]NHX37762.1 histidine ammonia-lyase [Halolamina sp. R1-12]SFP85098.1 histidine ammonia-lyase [Halolamina pelagica]